eukprot:m.55159 g.55159  ORF g.55159 m.55159 type:complete len:576 (+) comp34452_c0_seq13:1553-3280(+)
METDLSSSQSNNRRQLRRSLSTFDCIRDAVTILYRIDDFDLEPLGSGFFSDVYKVRHRSSGQVLVLKLGKSTSSRAQILQEVELMKRLSHPNILRFHGVCVRDGQLHPLSEFINGGSLDELLLNTDENLSWTFRFQLARDIASGMNYLHSKGVIHRDLTAKNCLVKRLDDGKASAIVADFGLAAKMPRISLTSDGRHVFSVVGTPFSMAPEVLNGERYNEKADVFSYGIILCQIIARISSDPDFMPRTKDFGVDGGILQTMVPECPSLAWSLAMECCQMDPLVRPDFQSVHDMLEANYLMPYTETPPLPSEVNSLHFFDSSDEGGDSDQDHPTPTSVVKLRRSHSFDRSFKRASSAERSLAGKKRLTYSPSAPWRSPAMSYLSKEKLLGSTTQCNSSSTDQTGSSSSGIHSCTSEDTDETEMIDFTPPLTPTPTGGSHNSSVIETTETPILSPLSLSPAPSSYSVEPKRKLGVCEVKGSEMRKPHEIQEKRRRRSSSRYATVPIHLSPEQFLQLTLFPNGTATSAPSSPNSSRRHLLNTESFRAALATTRVASERSRGSIVSGGSPLQVDTAVPS